MATKKKSAPKSPPGRSPKAHVDNPPREIAPHFDAPPAQGRETGQFTDRGSPGIWKK